MKFGINFIDNTTFSTIRVRLHNLTEDLLSELFTFNHTLTRGELSVQQSSKMNCGSTFNVRGVLSSQELSEFIKLKERRISKSLLEYVLLILRGFAAPFLLLTNVLINLIDYGRARKRI